MLRISLAAEAAIQTLLDHPDVPDGSGLRIIRVPRHEEPTQTAAVIDRRGPEDEVVAGAGIGEVFVDPEAVDLVDDQILDATIEDEQVTFSLEPQPRNGHQPI